MNHFWIFTFGLSLGAFLTIIIRAFTESYHNQDILHTTHLSTLNSKEYRKNPQTFQIDDEHEYIQEILRKEQAEAQNAEYNFPDWRSL
jgi:hypothetical protein